jgi:SOS response regulatory protein OraA/RecX
VKPQFSNHALERIENRNISKEIVLKVIDIPDSVSWQNDSVVVYSKIVEIDSKTYLYRVFVNSEKIPPLIITAYRTSKFEKYGY